MTRCGFVALAGRPNVGKSTLLNRLVGERIALTSPKAQSTRSRVAGLLTDDATQLVLLDTPGLLEPADKLHEAMQQTAQRAIREADVILHIADARGGPPRALWDEATWTGSIPATPIVVALNKSDTVSAEQGASLAEAPDHFLISAKTGAGIDAMLGRLRELIPESPFHYPADDASTADLRFIVAELVRETALEQLDEEIPHALACVVEEFRESRSPVYIRAVMYVERESQKRVVIGAGGARIREIGLKSRGKIEPLVGSQVYLDLWVKVLPNWRRDADALRRLGYSLGEDATR
jgi:GTP-binding protein Era